jgi:hypothetical protein
MLLTKHEGETFRNQTICVSGQAFVNCTFVTCTLVLRETACHIEQCTFDRCNWHVDALMLWGSPESLKNIRAILELIDQGQQELARQQAAASGLAAPKVPGPPPSTS